jgi:hypothetical protein
MRELHASTNFMSQEPGRIAHFGLGLNPIATEVVAEWSLGDAVLFENVAPNQEIVLPSPTATVDRRMAKTGETVMAFGAHVEPLSAPRSWLIEGATHEEADVSFSFATPGSKTLRLKPVRAGRRDAASRRTAPHVGDRPSTDHGGHRDALIPSTERAATAPA